MGKFIDLTGLKFNYLTVIERVYDDTNKKIVKWKCICDCGNECIVSGSNLKNGHTKSCGCFITQANKINAQHRIDDLTGQVFGNLTVLYRIDNKRGNTCWRCSCQCGRTIDVLSYNLKNGNTQSCGCLQKIKTSKARVKNISMKKFGYLTALFPTENRSSDKKVIWHCKCDCGNYLDVSIGSLSSGNTLSCGCLGMSKGENKIELILSNNNIEFEKQKRFDTCKFPDSNYYAYFDFYLPDYNLLIEYDGNQHFYYSNNKNTWNTKDNFEKVLEHDNYKNKWCMENNITLIRIPYVHYEELTLSDLLPDTSNFIFKSNT